VVDAILHRGMGAGLFTAWVERKFIGAEGSEFNFSIIERFLIAGRAIWFYLGKLFWPVDLVFIYPRWKVSQTAGGNICIRGPRCCCWERCAGCGGGGAGRWRDCSFSP